MKSTCCLLFIYFTIFIVVSADSSKEENDEDQNSPNDFIQFYKNYDKRYEDTFKVIQRYETFKKLMDSIAGLADPKDTTEERSHPHQLTV